jgi:dolichol-phosphate mannosyltransferase
MKTAAITPDFTLLIPCYNEQDVIEKTALSLKKEMDLNNISYEILCINNASTDGTEAVLRDLSEKYDHIRYVNTPTIPGYGVAVRWGLEHYRGNAVVIVMADGSEAPADVLLFFRKIQEGYDCAFGSRFIAEGFVESYPRFKLFINRLGNRLISIVTSSRYDDFTNGFKCYRREVIDAIQPLFSDKFNLTIEMSISATLSRPRIAIIPNSWRDRTEGVSKFNVVGQSKLYLMTLAYCFLRSKIQGQSWSVYRKSLHERAAHQVAAASNPAGCDHD